jgi:hypothetical protein
MNKLIVITLFVIASSVSARVGDSYEDVLKEAVGMIRTTDSAAVMLSEITIHGHPALQVDPTRSPQSTVVVFDVAKHKAIGYVIFDSKPFTPSFIQRVQNSYPESRWVKAPPSVGDSADAWITTDGKLGMLTNAVRGRASMYKFIVADMSGWEVLKQVEK